MLKFIKTESTFTSKSDFEVAASTAVSKGYKRTGDSLHANDSGVLVGFWSDGTESQQRGGWVSYCEMAA